MLSFKRTKKRQYIVACVRGGGSPTGDQRRCVSTKQIPIKFGGDSVVDNLIRSFIHSFVRSFASRRHLDDEKASK